MGVVKEEEEEEMRRVGMGIEVTVRFGMEEENDAEEELGCRVGGEEGEEGQRWG